VRQPCWLTFELRRPPRTDALPAGPMMNNYGSAGKAAGRGGSPLERGVRQHCSTGGRTVEFHVLMARRGVAPMKHGLPLTGRPRPGDQSELAFVGGRTDEPADCDLARTVLVARG